MIGYSISMTNVNRVKCYAILCLVVFSGCTVNNQRPLKKGQLSDPSEAVITSEVEEQAQEPVTVPSKSFVEERLIAKQRVENIKLPLDFEGDAFPMGVYANGNSVLRLTTYKFQHGKQSLEWEWDGEAWLDLDVAEISKEGVSVRNFLMWIFNKEADGSLDVLWGSKADVESGNGRRIQYELNFKNGWRSLWLLLDKDGGEVVDNLVCEKIRIKPSGKSGVLYFDLLDLAKNSIQHGRLGSYQMPFVKNDASNRHNYPWVAFDFKRTEDLPEANEANLKAIESIQERLASQLGNMSFGNPSKAKRYYPVVEKLVSVVDGKVVGPQVSSHIVDRHYRNQGVGGVHDSVIRAALYYCAIQYDETKEDLWKDRYIQYLDYLHEKGYAEGSSMMNLVFVAKNAGSYIASLLIMKPVLDHDRLSREVKTLQWISGYNNIYNPAIESVDADKMLGDLQTLLVAIYLQPTESNEEKMTQLYDFICLSRIISFTMKPGVTNQERPHIVTPDYSVCHHGQEMIFSYGGAANERYFVYDYIFHNTPAKLDEEVSKSLLLVYPKLLTQKGAGPITGTRGASAGGSAGFFNMLYFGSLSGMPESNQWLKYYAGKGVYPKDKLTAEIKKNVIDNSAVVEPKDLSGNWTQPFAAMMVHRRESWMACIRGMNHYTPSPEMFANPKKENCANVFGDQQGYGFLQLMNEGGVETSGIDLNAGGWDWSMYPGATTAQIPYKVLKNTMTEGKLISPKADASGGLSHFNKNGIFHLSLHGYAGKKKYPLKDLKGNKSWFFFDDSIICLGSGISNSDKNYPIVTNLFQYRHSDESEPISVFANGKLTKLNQDLKTKTLSGKGIVLTDPAGNTYHVNGGPSLKVSRGIQHSQEHRIPFKKNKGYYSKAWLDHGANPNDASYEYVINVQSKDANLSQIAKTKQYNVLRKDDAMHAIHHRSLDSYGYVFMKAVEKNAAGPILSVDKPVLAMVTRTKKDSVALTLCDPNVNVEREIDRVVGVDPSKVNQGDLSIDHVVVIKGEWRNVVCKTEAIDYKVSYSGGNTVIKTKTLFGVSQDYILKR